MMTTARPVEAGSVVAPGRLRQTPAPPFPSASSHWIDGQQKRDARLSAEACADDGVWINAFGRRIVGRQAIETFLAGLYAGPGYAQRHVFVPKEIVEVVFVRPDVAIARTFSRHGNQRLPNGTMIVERRSHNTMTLTREHDGWKIRYEIVTDERESSARP